MRWPWTAVVAFTAASLLSFVLAPACARTARRRGWLDQPRSDGDVRSAVPLLGGVAVIASFVAGTIAYVVVDPPGSRTVEVLAVLLGAAALMALGLADDRLGLPIGIRLAAEVAVALAIWLFGEGVRLTGVGPVDAVLTVVWIVAIVNALNLLDHHDGLAAGVTAIAAAWFFVIAATNGQELVAALAIGVTGCTLGFLRLNAPPARLYLGDAGSLALGFLLAVLGIKIRFPDADQLVTLFVPLLVLGVALFDVALVVVSRLLGGTRPWIGGRDHTAHRLRAFGWSARRVMVSVYVAALVLGGLGWLVAQSGRPVALGVSTATAVAGLVISARLRGAHVVQPTQCPQAG